MVFEDHLGAFHVKHKGTCWENNVERKSRKSIYEECFGQSWEADGNEGEEEAPKREKQQLHGFFPKLSI